MQEAIGRTGQDWVRPAACCLSNGFRDICLANANDSAGRTSSMRWLGAYWVKGAVLCTALGRDGSTTSAQANGKDRLQGHQGLA